jgi:MoxR-like ATPase
MNDVQPTAVGMDIMQAGALAAQLRSEIGKALVGQQAVVEQVIAALLAGGHVLVEGVPGLGKTLLVKALAKAISGHFARIQFTPDLMPSDITGHALFDPKTETFRIRRGPVFTHLLLADEINRAPAKTQAALLEVMQERQVTIEGKPFALKPPFMTLATQNPIEQEGTYPLPEAQLDRFLLKVRIEYPSRDEEYALTHAVTQGAAGDDLAVAQVQPVATPEAIIAAQQRVAALTVDSRVVHYAVNIVRATRDWKGIRYGAGPRGGIALIRVARAHALLQGRDFVTPDDVKHMALPVLRHRISLAAELEMEGVEVDHVLVELAKQVAAPRL